MAKRNYYQHSARREARIHYKDEERKLAFEYGFCDGARLILDNLKEYVSRNDTRYDTKCAIDIFIDAWTNVLTDDFEWEK